jgi:hypothetical protein
MDATGTTLFETLSRIRSMTGMHPILAAALRMNTQMAIDGDSERAAAQQSAADQKTSILWKGGKVSVKNMPAEDFVAAAADSSSRKLAEVSAMIEPTIQPSPEEAARHARLESYGVHTPPPIDPVLADPNVTKYRKNYIAARDLGDNPIVAAVKGIVGSVSPAVDPASPNSPLRRVETARSLNEASIENKYLLPAEEEADRLRRLDDAEKSSAVRRLREIIGKTNMASPEFRDEQARIQAVADEYGVAPDQLPKWGLAMIAHKTVTDVEKSRVSRLKEFRSDRKALGEYPTLHAALVAMGVPLAASETDGFKADYAAAREATLRQRQNDLYRAHAEERAADAAERTANKGKTVDAAALFRGTLTPETLLSYRGRKYYDQDSVEAAITAGTEHFSDAIQDRKSKMQEIDEVLASPPEKVTEADRMRFAKLRGQKRLLLAANQRDEKALAKLQQGASSRSDSQPSAQRDTPETDAVPIVTGSRGSVMKVNGKLVYQPH